MAKIQNIRTLRIIEVSDEAAKKLVDSFPDSYVIYTKKLYPIASNPNINGQRPAKACCGQRPK